MKFRKFYEKILNRAIRTDLSYKEALEVINTQKTIIIDVRDPEEYNNNHFKNSINIPLYEVDNIELIIKDKDEVILIYCKMGQRSEMAKKILLRKGYRNVYTFDAKV